MIRPQGVIEFPGPRGQRARARRPVLSVVVPVFEEEACIAPLWSALHPVLESLELSWEAIFVDDGSADASLEQLCRLPQSSPHVRVLQMSLQQGQTAALDAGFRAARGHWIATLDADLQNPPRELPRLLEAAVDVDLVFGRRRNREDVWIKRVASRVGNAVRNGITGHHVRDSSCSLKLFRRDALKRIPLYQGMHRFLPTLFVAHGFRVAEVVVEHGPRVAGRSKYGIWRRGLTGLADCFAVRWMLRRSLSYRAREIQTGPATAARED